MPADPRIDDVLAFWFGAGVKRWFTRDAAFDDDIRRRFGELHAAALRGELDAWRGDARSELAAIVVLDQFSRNLHRDSGQAFAGDARALAIAVDLFDSGRARELSLMERYVALLPFMHAEDVAAQDRCVREFAALVAEAPDAESRGMMEYALDYARRHRDIVARWGRFPHRNAVLGRATTPEEAAFLLEPGSSF